MRRGDVVITILPGDFGKPRPSVVVQSDTFAKLDSVIVCPTTSDESTPGLIRPELMPTQANGLRKTSLVMVDKISAVSRDRCRDIIGRIETAELERIDQALRLLLDHVG